MGTTRDFFVRQTRRPDFKIWAVGFSVLTLLLGGGVLGLPKCSDLQTKAHAAEQHKSIRAEAEAARKLLDQRISHQSELSAERHKELMESLKQLSRKMDRAILPRRR